MSFRITFLGTGGGRYTTMYQIRSTGGMLIEHDGRFLHVDPGPGALTQMQRIESVLEGMSKGGWDKSGHLYGSETVLNGNVRLGHCISGNHQGIAEGVTVFKPGDVLDVDGMRVDVCKAIHSDPTNVGFRFHTDHGIVSYVSDTEYTDEIADQYIGSRVVILPVTTPRGNRIKYHMCTDDVVPFLERVRPELAIFIHLGVVIIRRGPEQEAESVEKETGIRTVAAHDLMVLDVGDELTFSDAMTYEGGWIPDSSP